MPFITMNRAEQQLFGGVLQAALTETSNGTEQLILNTINSRLQTARYPKKRRRD